MDTQFVFIDAGAYGLHTTLASVHHGRHVFEKETR